MSFTAVLLTPNARPGNIVLAFYSQGSVVQAQADLTASATVEAAAKVQHPVHATLAGASSLLGGAALRAEARASLPGQGSFVGVALRVAGAHADLLGFADFTPTGVVHAEAQGLVMGGSTLTAEGIPAQEGQADLVGVATCGVDSLKIAILRYLPPIVPINVAVPQPYPRMTGQLPRTLNQTVILPGGPARTQIVGVRKPQS